MVSGLAFRRVAKPIVAVSVAPHVARHMMPPARQAAPGGQQVGRQTATALTRSRSHACTTRPWRTRTSPSSPCPALTERCHPCGLQTSTVRRLFAGLSLTSTSWPASTASTPLACRITSGATCLRSTSARLVRKDGLETREPRATQRASSFAQCATWRPATRRAGAVAMPATSQRCALESGCPRAVSHHYCTRKGGSLLLEGIPSSSKPSGCCSSAEMRLRAHVSIGSWCGLKSPPPRPLPSHVSSGSG